MMQVPVSATAESDCIALAVAFFREPSRFPELLHGQQRLPAGVTALLQLAAPSRVNEAGDAWAEQQQAARFFIKNVLMAHHADHYRVLGVQPQAGMDDIKEHHRLLMRLFHPDRQAVPDEHNDAIAIRINQAYTLVRDPQARASYDLGLAQKQSLKPAVARYVHLPQPLDAPGFWARMPPVVLRHLPQFALGSVALVAVLGVLLVYATRTPSGHMVAAHSSAAYMPEPAAGPPRPAGLPNAAAPMRALTEPAPPPAKPTAVTVQNPLDGANSPARRSAERMPAAVPAKTAPAVTPPAPAASAQGLARVAKTVEAPAHAAAPVPVPALAPTVAPAPTAEPAPPSLAAAADVRPAAAFAPGQLGRLAASLAERYQRGDLDGLMALFDPAARSDRGDKRQLRAEYGELFRQSESRSLHIWDMVWSGDATLTRGEGRFQARVLHRGEGTPRVHNGTVTLEVAQRHDRPVIVGLYQKAEN
ncbi:MAG: J domain-containing protein [Burkholderiaceae bacterium]|nr:MAG: J domain-containing protein [Burkholderiaceae bacterium]